MSEIPPGMFVAMFKCIQKEDWRERHGPWSGCTVRESEPLSSQEECYEWLKIAWEQFKDDWWDKQWKILPSGEGANQLPGTPPHDSWDDDPW